jgi:hypothetical protein
MPAASSPVPLTVTALSVPAGQEEGREGSLALRASSGTCGHGLLCHLQLRPQVLPAIMPSTPPAAHEREGRDPPMDADQLPPTVTASSTTHGRTSVAVD